MCCYAVRAQFLSRILYDLLPLFDIFMFLYINCFFSSITFYLSFPGSVMELVLYVVLFSCSQPSLSFVHAIVMVLYKLCSVPSFIRCCSQRN